MDATTFTLPIAEDSLKKGKYKSPKGKKGKDKSSKGNSNPVVALKINTNKGKMKFSVKKADLTGLSFPMTVTFQIGIYVATIELDETIVNGSKPCPPELMDGI